MMGRSTRHGVWTTLALLLSTLVAASARADGPLEVDTADLRPGLVAQYRSRKDKTATLSRLEAKPAFSLGRSTPHPRLPNGPFEVTWTGVIHLTGTGPFTFDALVCGEVTVEVDGVVAVQGRGASETAHVGPGKKLVRDPGFYRLTVHYRSLDGLPARLQLWWEGTKFAHEPLSAWYLKHLPGEVPAAVASQQRAELGRKAVEQRGCARCHHRVFPDVIAPPPGPSLADVNQRIHRDWLLAWLENPAKLRPQAHMPVLFQGDRQGEVERWLLVDYLLAGKNSAAEPSTSPAGDHRLGRRAFVSLGCAACHHLPDAEPGESRGIDRTSFVGLKDRFSANDLATFLGNPHQRYPDGRMPRLPITPDVARDLAAFLLEWSKPAPVPGTLKAPSPAEIQAVGQRLHARGPREIGAKLVREKGCADCHTGLGQGLSPDLPFTGKSDKRGCLAGNSLPRFPLDASTRAAILAYQEGAALEKYHSPFANRQRQLAFLGCVRCHQRDSDRPPPLETIGSTLGGAWLQNIPYQRTPRLSFPHQKYSADYLRSAVREGVSGLRHARYSYRMPSFGREAEWIVQALAEGDGELLEAEETAPAKPADPTLGSLTGPNLVGFQGYACVSCHVWKGQTLADPDPGAIGTDLTRIPGRIRRAWFDRFLEGPARFHPNTPMPAIFEKGKPALLRAVLDADAAKQKEALWSYFALGDRAPTPKPPPPMPIEGPGREEPPLVAQIPMHLPDGEVLESLCLLHGSHDLFVYDLGTAALHSGWTGAQIQREVQGRLRRFLLAGTPLGTGLREAPPWQLQGRDRLETPQTIVFHGYERLADGARLRFQLQFPSAKIELVETVRLQREGSQRRLVRHLTVSKAPSALVLLGRSPVKLSVSAKATSGAVKQMRKGEALQTTLLPDDKGEVAITLTLDLPAETAPAMVPQPRLLDTGSIEGSLVRPGYRALAYPRPKTASGEDRVMPGAIAVDPRQGRVFVASMKTGEILAVRDPSDDGKQARFENYTGGLFQECYSMLADREGLYVLHRRNLTRVLDTDHDGRADRFERVATLPHGIADTYDYAYGLARDRTGAFIYTFAPYANTHLPGSGSALRLVPGKKPQEIGYGFRNPLGWCSGPDGEIFFTDNQGEWVATNKLCHLVEGHFHGFPNPAQRDHARKPRAKTTVWIPYGWAKSINGMAYDNTGGKFGPFDGQIFLAELMFGGAIIRANVEKVNGQYQGACFPFWGRGLLGPVTMAFDPRGRLWVGGITEPGWMAQPDRGALFRLDFTGVHPFEIRSIHVLPRGFRLVFTRPVSAATARELASYRIDYHRYEYTGAYGSAELERTRLPIERVEVSTDGRSVELHTAALVKDRVYMIQASGVRSAQGEALVHPTGAYTLNEIPTSGEKRKE